MVVERSIAVCGQLDLVRVMLRQDDASSEILLKRLQCPV